MKMDCDTSKGNQWNRFDDDHDARHDRAEAKSDYLYSASISSRSEVTLRGWDIFQSAPMGMGLISNHFLVDVNRRLCDMIGYDRHELIGKHLDILCASSYKRDPSEARRYKQVVEGESETIECRWRHKDGRVIDILLCTAPLDPADLSKGISFTAMDITQCKRRENILEASQRRHRTLFETAHDAIFIIRGNTIVDCNSKTLQIFGGTREQIIGRTPYEISPEKQLDGRNSKDAAIELIQAGQAGSYRFFHWTHQRLDGTCFDAEVSLNQVELPDGLHIQAIVRDITDRKRVENALRQSEEKYRSLLVNIPDVIWTCDEYGITTFISPNIESVCGYKPEEICGCSGHPWFHNIHPDDLTKVREAEERLFRENIPLDVEYRFKKKDGQWIWLQDRSIGTYVKNSVCYTDGVFIDITKRKKTEEALRRSEAEFRTIFELSPYAIIFTDLQGCILTCNQQFTKLYGTRHGPKAQIGRNLLDYFPQEERARISNSIEIIVRDRVPLKPMESFILHEDGTRFPAEITGTLVMDQDGQPRAFLGLVHDITERKKVEQQRLNYEAKLRSLASELALAEEQERRRIAADLHDHACQSLALSKMKVQALLKLGDPTQAESLQSICEMLNETIENVRELTFDLSSPTLYKIGLEAALEELLRDKLRREHNIMYRFSDDGRRKPLSQDVLVLLFQCVRELLINVIKHAQAQEVVLDIRRKDRFITIAVSDDGVGFDANEIWIPTPDRRSVGLFNVRERLEYIGGRLDIDSYPGRGSRFVLMAPLQTDVHVAKESDDGTENPAG